MKKEEQFRKADRVIRSWLEMLKKEGAKKQFALFPFGDQGMMIKKILNEKYGIKEKYIIDNGVAKVSDNPAIVSLADMDSVDKEDIIVLLTSDNEEIYSEIRYQLTQYFRMEQIVDVFSYSMYFDPKVYYDPFHYDRHRHCIRLNALEANARELYHNNVEGAVAECGVWRGEFAKYINRLLPDRKIYLFDTFSGFDNKDIDEQEEKFSKKFRDNDTFSDTSVEVALSNIAYRKNAIVRKGYFPETAAGLEEERFAFVSLDTDLYKPILAGLEFFYPRMNPGGVIFVDNLGHPELPGVKKAVIEFCRKEKVGYVSIPDEADMIAVFVKPLA